jgi:putative ABC transport system permease protein
MLADTIRMALRSIVQNLMRSALTMLGIVIGVGSVVALITIGEGAAAQVKQEISSMGENLLTLHPGAPRRPGEPHQDAEPFTLEDARVIRQEISGIDHAAPSQSSQIVVIYGNQNWSSSVMGTTSAYLDCHGYRIAAGRTFSETEETGLKPLCILGETVRRNLFDTENAQGERVRVGKALCTVIGTLASKGQNAMGFDQDDMILMPIRAFQRRIAGNDHISRISISVSKGKSTTAVKTSVEALMRDRRNVAPGTEDDFEVRDMAEIASVISQTTGVMTALLSAIAAVSLLVGGIGIMNIMLVSVTERTREIGIRLAIGARRSEVQIQFLVEAAALSGLGGLFGLLIGYGGAWVSTQMLLMPFIPSFLVAALALAFSIGVGVLFGMLPAHRASRLDPMEALRHE